MSASAAQTLPVAVVIPCYNDGATVEDAYRSALVQQPAELVIVDDGSSDPATLRKLDELRARGARVIRQENQGLSAARMRGVAATSSPFVQPLDADDVLAPGALRTLLAVLEQTAADVAWGEVRSFGRSDLLWRAALPIDRWMLTHVNPLPGWPLLRRSTLLAAGGWRQDAAYQDWDLYLSLAELGAHGVFVPRLFMYYRVHSSSRMWRSSLASLHENLDDLRRHHPELWRSRRRLWLRSTAPPRCRLLLPLIEALPLPLRARLALKTLVAHPRPAARSQLRKLTARFTRPKVLSEQAVRDLLRRAEAELAAEHG